MLQPALQAEERNRCVSVSEVVGQWLGSSQWPTEPNSPMHWNPSDNENMHSARNFSQPSRPHRIVIGALELSSRLFSFRPFCLMPFLQRGKHRQTVAPMVAHMTLAGDARG